MCRQAFTLTQTRCSHPCALQREKSRAFLRITVALPNMVTVARGVLEKGMSIPGLSCGPLVLPTFESNVLFILRFMVDCQARGYCVRCLTWRVLPHLPCLSLQVTGGNWVELPAGAWQHTKRRVSNSQARCAASESQTVCRAVAYFQ